MFKLSKVRTSGIIQESIVDGIGLRYVVFFQGCPHNCRGCQNPQTHSFSGGIFVDVDKIINDVVSNPLLDGITLSGGEPLCYPRQCCIIAKEVRKYGKTVWMYSGYTFEEIMQHYHRSILMHNIDVLVDGPFVYEQRDLNLRFRGSTNQRIIDVQKSLAENKIVLWSEDNGY